MQSNNLSKVKRSMSFFPHFFYWGKERSLIERKPALRERWPEKLESRTPEFIGRLRGGGDAHEGEPQSANC